jgi:flagellar biosynthesis protein FlhF
MNLKRFTARSSREALALVREAFGNDAIVMSNKPCAEGVEVLAMAPESLQQLERLGAQAEPVRAHGGKPGQTTAGGFQSPALQERPRQPAPAHRAPERVAERVEPRLEPVLEATVAQAVARDVEQLQMSTLSFQDYVRERMLRRRRAEMQAAAQPAQPELPAPVPATIAPIEAARQRLASQRQNAPMPQRPPTQAQPAAGRAAMAPPPVPQNVPVLRDEVSLPMTPAQHHRHILHDGASVPSQPLPARLQAAEAQPDMMRELRSMRGLIEQRFGALAFMEKLQRHPRQAQLSQRLLEAGFSPALIRKLVQGLPADVDELHWAQGVLERNLPTGERESALEDSGGIFALVGATGVGKTTSTAKLAAAFATRHGAAHLGLVTLDVYRVAAHEQLRAYGRILGVPVHTAHDRASLEDLLDLLSAKKLVLIDTAGMAQRDTRTRELLDMLAHRSIQRLLVVNAASQGETIEDQLAAYAAPGCRGIVLSKLDEAVKLAPALDALIRHKLKVLAVATGQRVPEDWHRLSAHALVQRALRSVAATAWKPDADDVNLIFAGLPAASAAVGTGAAVIGTPGLQA